MKGLLNSQKIILSQFNGYLMRFLNYMILGSLIFAFIEILKHFKPIFYLLTPEKVRIILVAGDIEVGILV